MVKTRRQASHSQIKKKEREDKPKLEQLLHSEKYTSNSKNKITKKEKTAGIKPIQVQNVNVKSENTDDCKEILALPMKTWREISTITTDQIAKLIDYIINDKMTMSAAARKVKVPPSTANRYYQEYQNDPEHKIPSPRAITKNQSLRVTQKKIENLINYIVHEKMSVPQAAYKANISGNMAYKYYRKYMGDPDRKIPVLEICASRFYRRYSQKQIKELIRYITDDSMSITSASKKANVGIEAGRKYYLKYLKDPNHKIPVPRENGGATGKRCTNDQLNRLFGCIVDDGVSILEASVIADMSMATARKYYKQYLDDPNHDIPTPTTNYHCNSFNYLFPDQLRVFLNYIIIDRLSVQEASLKAKISIYTGQKYYTRCFENPINMGKSTDMSYSTEKMKKMVEYIQNNKMSLRSAAAKSNLCYSTARKYYRLYMKNPQLGIPIALKKELTQEYIKKLVDCIEHDNMSIYSAAKRMKMSYTSAHKYYNLYQNDSEHKIPVPSIRKYRQKRKTIDICSQIIADIYKNNPSIKPMHGNHLPSDSPLPDMTIKRELLDQDTKIMLKDKE